MTDILVACHDAGGAEVVSSWLRANAVPERCEFVLAGPAVDIFRRKLGSVCLVDVADLEIAVRRAERVLTGSGWGSDLEYRTIVAARKHGTRAATFLDHWVNYGARFLRDGKESLPDEIWVGDEYARQIAIAEFPGTKIILQPNDYFLEMADQIRSLKEQYSHMGPPRILFVSEPKAAASRAKWGHERYWGYTEREALEGYLEWLRAQGSPVGEIRVRPHPAEPSGKYQDILARFGNCFRITESRGTHLVDDCAWADWVVGCESMAMVVALLAGRKVFSCIPKNGLPLSLPHEGITRLFA